ncbi:hypothetical protein [Leucobacter massiliensis]|uniref:Lipoprotein n=1 Tax=Leucobacter massiliensis TaxID=1686285 RepID=A0A2S9QQN6_9MICO|nr:hypothetical protein [Leucobacter massiliensis]PRI11894.1 hypothetical protein B4915_02115 [Leucobacter massiliensis]
MKRTLAAAAIALLALTGCSSSDTDTDAAPASEETTTEEPATPADLTGSWKQTNSNSPTNYQQATITAETISIDWVNEENDSTSIYWVGTYTAPTEAGDTWTWTSTRDAAATDTAMMASTDDTKDFTYTDGVISYEVTAMGTTVTVELEKQ